MAYLAFFSHCHCVFYYLNHSMIMFLNQGSVGVCIAITFLISILILQKDEQLIGIILELCFEGWMNVTPMFKRATYFANPNAYAYTALIVLMT